MSPLTRIITGTACLALLLLLNKPAIANNIQVSNVTLTNTHVTFDISWENSWRGGGVMNWDAAWVFVKFRASNGVWSHVRPDETGHTAPAGSQIDLGLLTPGEAYHATNNPVIGVFIRRDADGTGTFSATGVELRWDLAAAGLGFNDIAEVRVFAIEMVHVNEGAFAAGSGGSESDAFTLTTINTANATTAPAGTGGLGGQAGGYPTGQTAPANASWPNGFRAFYCMKYELSQQQYVDFLNTLTYIQQDTRTATAPNSTEGTGALSSTIIHRIGIAIQTPGVDPNTPAVYACNLNGNSTYGEATDGTDVACGLLSTGDLLGYLDWSGLRPISELEFEKACRGPLTPVPNEYSWGTTGIANSPYTLSDAGASNEDIATNYSATLGNAAYILTIPIDLAISGSLRVGIFASNGSNSGRVSAGASYFGIMELSGNLWEYVVTIGNLDGRSYTDAHGNGSLAANGDPDVATWPSASTAVGGGFRGGAWATSVERLHVSDRSLATNSTTFRSEINGGRGVRLSP